MTEDPATPKITTGPARWLLLGLGLVFSGLGAAGVFLPVLPTTPFLLLAAACFARSSPAFHRRLLGIRLFGPYIAQWQRDHTIPQAAKSKAYLVVLLTFGLSIAFVDAGWLRAALALVGMGLLGLLAWLPTTSASSLASASRPTAERRSDPSAP